MLPRVTKVVIGVAAVAAWSCSTLGPQDLKIESLTIVSIKQDPSLSKVSPSSFLGDMERARLLKVGISSRTDLVRLAKDGEVNVWYSAFLCDSSQVRSELVSTSDLRVEHEWLEGANFFPRPDLNDLRDSDGRIVYYAVIPLDSAEMRSVYAKDGIKPAADKAPLYEPGRDTMDICVVLQGGRMWTGSSFRSEPLRIQREAIVAAGR
jgi:hypothetical protein